MQREAADETSRSRDYLRRHAEKFPYRWQILGLVKGPELRMRRYGLGNVFGISDLKVSM